MQRNWRHQVSTHFLVEAEARLKKSREAIWRARRAKYNNRAELRIIASGVERNHG